MSKKISRRKFLEMSAAGATGLVVAACAPPAPGSKPAAPTVAATSPPAQSSRGVRKGAKLKFWLWNTYAPDADDVLEKGIQAWAADNGVTVEISRDSDAKIEDKVLPALEAGTLPDALFASSNAAIRMMNAGGLEPLDTLFKDIGNEHGGWLPKLYEYVFRDGKIGFLPYSIDTAMVQFREDIFKKAGIKVPDGTWTWQETRDLCLQAQNYTEKQGNKLVGWGFGVVNEQHDGWCGDLFRNFGADIWDATGKKVILKDQKKAEAVRALNFAKEAWKMGLFPADAASWDYSSNNKAYQEERAILVINAASVYTWCQANKPALAEGTGLRGKPKEARDTTVASLRYTVVMPKTSKEKETTAELIKALYSKKIYAPWLEKGFVTNVVHEYDTLPMWTGKRAVFNQVAQTGVYSGYPAPYDNVAMAETGGPNDPAGKMIVRVLIDGWEPEKAIDEADAFVKKIFAKHF